MANVLESHINWKFAGWGMPEEEYMTPEEIGKILRVHTNTVYGWIKKGLLPAIRVGDLYRVSRTDFENFKKPVKPEKK